MSEDPLEDFYMSLWTVAATDAAGKELSFLAWTRPDDVGIEEALETATLRQLKKHQKVKMLEGFKVKYETTQELPEIRTIKGPMEITAVYGGREHVYAGEYYRTEIPFDQLPITRKQLFEGLEKDRAKRD